MELRCIDQGKHIGGRDTHLGRHVSHLPPGLQHEARRSQGAKETLQASRKATQNAGSPIGSCHVRDERLVANK